MKETFFFSTRDVGAVYQWIVSPQVFYFGRRRYPVSEWIKEKYFPDTGPNRWVFTGVLKNEEGQTKVVRLFVASSVRIERHTKIRAEANPNDPVWEPYFEQRLDLHMAGTLS